MKIQALTSVKNLYKGYKIYPCGERLMIEIEGVIVDEAESEFSAKKTIDNRLG